MPYTEGKLKGKITRTEMFNAWWKAYQEGTFGNTIHNARARADSLKVKMQQMSSSSKLFYNKNMYTKWELLALYGMALGVHGQCYYLLKGANRS